MDYKQVIVYNKNSNLSFNSCLNFIVQGSLASVSESFKLKKDKTQNWLRFGQKKITLHVPHENDLIKLKSECDKKNIVNILLHTDSSVPCLLVIGPDLEKLLDPISGQLKLF
jgi:peptidyl-tRNA hydrolase